MGCVYMLTTDAPHRTEVQRKGFLSKFCETQTANSGTWTWCRRAGRRRRFKLNVGQSTLNIAVCTHSTHAVELHLINLTSVLLHWKQLLAVGVGYSAGLGTLRECPWNHKLPNPLPSPEWAVGLLSELERKTSSAITGPLVAAAGKCSYAI